MKAAKEGQVVEKALNEGSAVSADGERGRRKTQVGVVVSTKMSKTIVVQTVRSIMHRKYGKFVRRTSKFYAHDERSECGLGDEVLISETRPLSKTKRWKLDSIVKKAE